MNFAELNHQNAQVASFDPVLEVQDIKQKPELRTLSEAALSPRGDKIAITTKDGILLGFMSDYQVQTWGDGIRAMVSDGLTPTTKVELHSTSQSVHGEVYLDSDLERFFGDHAAKLQPNQATLMRAQYAYDDHKKESTLTWVLWFFLSGVAAHRFYLGQINWALGICAVNLLLVPFLLFNGQLWALLIPLIVFVLEGCLIPSNLREANSAARQREFSKYGMSEYA